MACTQTCCHPRPFDATVYLQLDFHPEGRWREEQTKEEKTVKGKRLCLCTPPQILWVHLCSLPPDVTSAPLCSASKPRWCVAAWRVKSAVARRRSRPDWEEMSLLVAKSKCGRIDREERRALILMFCWAFIDPVITLKVLYVIISCRTGGMLMSNEAN